MHTTARRAAPNHMSGQVGYVGQKYCLAGYTACLRGSIRRMGLVHIIVACIIIWCYKWMRAVYHPWKQITPCQLAWAGYDIDTCRPPTRLLAIDLLYICMNRTNMHVVKNVAMHALHARKLKCPCGHVAAHNATVSGLAASKSKTRDMMPKNRSPSLVRMHATIDNLWCNQILQLSPMCYAMTVSWVYYVCAAS